MKFTSTRNRNVLVSSAQAILQGLSTEGGLFVPTEFPSFNLTEICEMNYATLAYQVLAGFLTDYDADFLQQTAKQVYDSAFGNKAGCLQQINQSQWALELWHGPTCAFKDYALQMMPRLLVQARKMLNVTENTLILVATSGDTGKAALEGYRDLQGVQMKVFYPTGGTSEIQRLQMATQQGNNLEVYAVQGNFDQAQSGVKKVFADERIKQLLAEKGIVLSSANSINWGRLVPQIVYYFYSYAQLVKQKQIVLGDRVNFCVPTGNFGDILAGWYAKQMGLPIRKLICASNQNNVLTEFFATGVYNSNREFFKTTSPSMDILISSNLERLLYHVSGQNSDFVMECMHQLQQKGKYTLPKEILQKIQQDFGAGWASDQQAEQEIKTIWQQSGYLCDPHTAVAFCVANSFTQQQTNPWIILSTASPYKFPVSVLRALGKDINCTEFEALQFLKEQTKTEIPVQIQQLEHLPERFDKIISPKKIVDAVMSKV